MNRLVSERQRLARLWGAAVASLLVLAPWAGALAKWVPPCPLKTWTGIPCPGCGATRAALALARLDVGHALHHYPIMTLGWMLFVLGGVVAGLWALSPRPLPSRPLPRWLPVALGVLLLASWVFNIKTGV